VTQISMGSTAALHRFVRPSHVSMQSILHIQYNVQVASDARQSKFFWSPTYLAGGGFGWLSATRCDANARQGVQQNKRTGVRLQTQ
jgi:hypothetical protein